MRYVCLSCVAPPGYASLVFEDREAAQYHLKAYPGHFLVQEATSPFERFVSNAYESIQQEDFDAIREGEPTEVS